MTVTVQLTDRWLDHDGLRPIPQRAGTVKTLKA